MIIFVIWNGNGTTNNYDKCRDCSVVLQDAISGVTKESRTIAIFSSDPWESILHGLYQIYRQLVVPCRSSDFFLLHHLEAQDLSSFLPTALYS